MECVASHLKSLKKKFLRVSSQATITHLKKFIAVKVLDGSDKYRDVTNNLYYFLNASNVNTYNLFGFQIDILCNDELLGKDHTLKFVYVTRWRFREPPLKLQYRPKLDL